MKNLENLEERSILFAEDSHVKPFQSQESNCEPKVAVPVLTPDRVEKRQNGRRFKENGEPMFTLTTQDRHGMLIKEPNKQGVLVSDYKIRKLTPKECWRLQGFPDELFDKAQKVNSNSQLYKQAGNSVTVNVVEEIAKRLK